jgi:hypothetical protein
MANAEELKVHEWYFGFICTNCGKFIPYAHDQERGEAQLQFVNPKGARLTITCQACGQAPVYRPDDLRSVQLLPGGWNLADARAARALPPSNPLE